MSQHEPEFTIQCFGPFQVNRHQNPIEFPNLVSAKLVALLSVRPSRPFLRSEIAGVLWPDFEEERQRANLRTALSTARKALRSEDAIIADRQSIHINSNLVSTDVRQRQQFRSISGLSPERETEIAALESELNIISKSFLEGWDDAWVFKHRTLWKRRKVESLTQLAQCLERCGRFEEAFKASKKALKEDPLSSDALATALRSSMFCDQSHSGYALFLQSHSLMKETLGTGHPAAIVRLAEHVKSIESNSLGTTAAKLNSPQEQETLFRTFESALNQNPQSAIDFLAINFRTLSFLPDIDSTIKLLSTAISLAPGPSNNLNQLNRLAFYLCSQQSRYEDALELAKKSLAQLEGEENQVDRALFLSNYGFTLMEIRDYPGAEEAFEEANRILAKHDNTRAKANVLINQAGMKLHQLQFKVAEEMYENHIRLAGGESAPAVSQASTLGNLALINTFQHDWDAAIANAEAALPYAQAVGSPYISSLVNALFGLATATKGDFMKARVLLVESVRQCSRANIPRMACCVLDVVAEALCHLNQSRDGMELAAAVSSLRDSIGHVRSPAEQRQFDGLIKEFWEGQFDPKGVLNDQGIANVFAWTVSRLKQDPA